MQYGLDMRGQQAQDAFWWLALRELEERTAVSAVEFTVEERVRQDSLPSIAHIAPDISFTVTGCLMDMVRPFPPAAESLARIRRTLDSWMGPPAPVPMSPVPAVALKPAPAAEPPMLDDMSARFGLLELD
jgi:hypothetical protein